jgi:hypothetical protein
MAKLIPFPVHLTQQDVAFSNALGSAQLSPENSYLLTLESSDEQGILALQMLKQLLSQTTGTGNMLDPNAEVSYFPEDSFVIQERYL